MSECASIGSLEDDHGNELALCEISYQTEVEHLPQGGLVIAGPDCDEAVKHFVENSRPILRGSFRIAF